MTQNKTLSTRVSTNIYKLFTEQCDEDSISISQCLKQMITDLSLGRKEYEDSSQCSIDNKVEKISTTTPTFSQNNKFEKELKYLQDENIQESIKQKVKMEIGEYLNELKLSIQNLAMSMDKKLDEDKMKKGMACFVNDSCFTT